MSITQQEQDIAVLKKALHAMQAIRNHIATSLTEKTKVWGADEFNDALSQHLSSINSNEALALPNSEMVILKDILENEDKFYSYYDAIIAEFVANQEKKKLTITNQKEKDSVDDETGLEKYNLTQVFTALMMLKLTPANSNITHVADPAPLDVIETLTTYVKKTPALTDATETLDILNSAKSILTGAEITEKATPATPIESAQQVPKNTNILSRLEHCANFIRQQKKSLEKGLDLKGTIILNKLIAVLQNSITQIHNSIKAMPLMGIFASKTPAPIQQATSDNKPAPTA
jgi:hypothetical protein